MRLTTKAPQAEAHCAMAMLLATCPTERYRNGEKAVECATKACQLTQETNWICLDALAAAHAEAGDFDGAVQWANKAIQCAPASSQEAIRGHIALYQDKKPNRLK
jgi:serine/threonine-protein kinase